ncbi:MAG: hypothetical protein MK238_00765 [Nitrospinales bacterium]|nr:hypothetical protein [Nitrospinales bacterium]
MSIIRRTAVGERPLILILIAVNFLPASVRIGIQRITYLDYGLQLRSYLLTCQRHSRSYTSTYLQEFPSV